MSVGSGFLIHLPLEEGANMGLDDLFGNVDLESIERKVDFERMLATLSERDRRVVLLYAQGYTQVEIGVEVGVSDRQVRRILKTVSAFTSETR